MTDRPILLDTHAALWLADTDRLSEAAIAALDFAQEDDVAVLLSPISAWELGLLVSKGRVAITAQPEPWLDALIDDGLGWAPLTPHVLVSASFLPGNLHGDPADRILAATARAFDYRLMTRDRALLAYAAAGHLKAIAC